MLAGEGKEEEEEEVVAKRMMVGDAESQQMMQIEHQASKFRFVGFVETGGVRSLAKEAEKSSLLKWRGPKEVCGLARFAFHLDPERDAPFLLYDFSMINPVRCLREDAASLDGFAGHLRLTKLRWTCMLWLKSEGPKRG